MHELSIATQETHPVHRLPFVGRVPGRDCYSFWVVPSAGCYTGACETGSALATIYLKHLREHGSIGGGIFQAMVLDMFDCQWGVSAEQDSLRGQVVGFFSVLEGWLAAAATHLGGNLDRVDAKQLLEKANHGLNFDEDAEQALMGEA